MLADHRRYIFPPLSLNLASAVTLSRNAVVKPVRRAARLRPCVEFPLRRRHHIARLRGINVRFRASRICRRPTRLRPAYKTDALIPGAASMATRGVQPAVLRTRTAPLHDSWQPDAPPALTAQKQRLSGAVSKRGVRSQRADDLYVCCGAQWNASYNRLTSARFRLITANPKGAEGAEPPAAN